jgi:hypothetical protein
MATTTNYSLTESAWTEIGTGPARFIIQRLTNGAAAMHVANSAPLIEETDFIVLDPSADDDLEISVSTNERIYARATGGSVAVGVVQLAAQSASGGGGGNDNHDRELVVTTYRVRTAFTGASVGDTVTCTQIIDVKNTPSTVSTIWRNQTTAADLAAAPSAANLELVGSQALTDAQLRASAVAVSAAALPLPSGAATETTLSALNAKIPAQAITGLLPVDTLGTPGASRAQATSGTAAGVTLTSTCRRVSMFATQGTWYSLSGTATATSHYIGAGERLDFDVPASTTISVLRETTDGSIRITELV